MGSPSAKHSILIMSKNQRNMELMKQFLEPEGYQCQLASDVQQGEDFFKRIENLDLVLIDIHGFSSKIWPFCDQLKQRDVPFLIISPKESPQIMQKVYEHGAAGIKVKPLVIKELLALIKALIKES